MNGIRMVRGGGVAMLLGVIGVMASPAQEAEKPAEPGRHVHTPEEMNRGFLNPNLDIEAAIRQMESDRREVAVKRPEIVNAMALQPGDQVADIGAGTGLFAREFAHVVGPEGRVYAVEVAPAFLKHLAATASQPEFSMLCPIEGGEKTTGLPTDSINVAFVCDTYHHFEHPQAILASIHQALKEGGRLYVVDFDRRDDSSDFVKSHTRATQQEFVQEIEAAGFERFEPEVAVTMKDNFLAAFRKRASTKDDDR